MYAFVRTHMDLRSGDRMIENRASELGDSPHGVLVLRQMSGGGNFWPTPYHDISYLFYTHIVRHLFSCVVGTCQ